MQRVCNSQTLVTSKDRGMDQKLVRGKSKKKINSPLRVSGYLTRNYCRRQTLHTLSRQLDVKSILPCPKKYSLPSGKTNDSDTLMQFNQQVI